MIVAGFGFRAAATPASLRDAFDKAQGAARATHIATAADKVTAPAFRALADALGLPALGVAPSDLCAQTTLTRSSRALAERGTGSVAEAAALAAALAAAPAVAPNAAGSGAALLGARRISTDRMASCALAAASHEGQDR
ncbi:cobalamin biosynthesis protein [Salipiger aestuarii]|uniref:cobalamin biosynthesis protein n=1 Tax=Salipiger aestuarii TaxID=568098 RepID=UPI00123B5975|nr:cobalamin biosynthesis protein [Salipiger aestuarii]KAA8610497.1 precorrin methylase [Salipiger aestuarii]